MRPQILETTALITPSFVKPLLIHYEQNGLQKKWEAVQSHDSVSVLLYNTDLNSFVLVKQFRPPVLFSNKKEGMMYELCAGIVDKKLSLERIVQEEIYEECGYNVPLEHIEKITSFYTNVGISGAKQTLFYATINESMKRHEGGGIEDEAIEVLHIKVEEAKKFMFDETYQKTPGLITAFYWFFDNKQSSGDATP